MIMELLNEYSVITEGERLVLVTELMVIMEFMVTEYSVITEGRAPCW